MAPGAGIGAGREIRPAKQAGIGHERIRGVEIDLFEHIRTPESHLVPHGTRQPLAAGGHHLIQQPHGTRIAHAPGHRVGKIGIKPLRQAFYQLRFRHTDTLPLPPPDSVGSRYSNPEKPRVLRPCRTPQHEKHRQNNFFFDVVTTKSFR